MLNPIQPMLQDLPNVCGKHLNLSGSLASEYEFHYFYQWFIQGTNIKKIITVCKYNLAKAIDHTDHFASARGFSSLLLF